jgi:hypothetical protein
MGNQQRIYVRRMGSPKTNLMVSGVRCQGKIAKTLKPETFDLT